MAIPSFTYQPNYSVDTTPFDSASSYLDQAGKAALPSQAAYDTAAARIRGRLEAKQRGDENRALDVFGRSGNSGQYNQQFRQARQDAQSNLATGLADLEDKFWGKQQEGANILANIGTTFGNIGTGKADAQRGGEQLNMDAARNNAGNFNNILSTLGQSGGVLSLFQNANANNPNFSQPFEQLFGEGFKFPDANAIASFTNASLANTGANSGGNTTAPKPPVDGGSAFTPGSGFNGAEYGSSATISPQDLQTFRNRLTIRNGRVFDPVTQLYVYSDAQLKQLQASGAQIPHLINGIGFYPEPSNDGFGMGTFPAT